MNRDSLGFDVRHCWQMGLLQQSVMNKASRSLAVGGSEPQHARHKSMLAGENSVKVVFDIVVEEQRRHRHSC